MGTPAWPPAWPPLMHALSRQRSGACGNYRAADSRSTTPPRFTTLPVQRLTVHLSASLRCGLSHDRRDFLPDRRRVSGTIGASRADQHASSPLGMNGARHMESWNVPFSSCNPTVHAVRYKYRAYCFGGKSAGRPSGRPCFILERYERTQGQCLYRRVQPLLRSPA